MEELNSDDSDSEEENEIYYYRDNGQETGLERYEPPQ